MYLDHRIEEAPMDMSKFDSANMAVLANNYLKTIKEPRRRKILINFRDHALAECLGDYEALMATCSQARQDYRVTGHPEMDAMMPQDYASLCEYYKMLVDTKMYVIHTECEKLILDDDALFIEVVFQQIYPGEMVEDYLNIKTMNREGTYVAVTRAGVIFVFDEDGKGCGEQTFTAGPVTADRVRELSPHEIPERYTAGPMLVKDWLAERPDLDWPSE